MNRSRTLLITGVITACGVAAGGYFAMAGATSGGGTRPSALHLSAHLQQYPWTLLEVGRGGRSLVIQYRPPACGGPGHPIVEATSTTVTVHIAGHVVVPSQARRIACTAMLATPQLVVPLPSPIAGRRILGEDRSLHRLSFGYLHSAGRGTLLRPLLPNVIGLSRADALAVLRRQGFGASVSGRGAIVVGQHPARGQLALGAKPHSDDGGKVYLTLGN